MLSKIRFFLQPGMPMSFYKAYKGDRRDVTGWFMGMEVLCHILIPNTDTFNSSFLAYACGI